MTNPPKQRPRGESVRYFQLRRVGLEGAPALEHAGVRHFMNGPESCTSDTLPLLRESPFLDGFFVAAGFNTPARPAYDPHGTRLRS